MGENDTYSMFNRIFGEDVEKVLTTLTTAGAMPDKKYYTQRLEYAAPQFPPVDVEIDEDTKDLYFTFALAGYREDEVALSFEGDNMKLSSEIISKEKSNKRFLKKGIKKTSFSCRYNVPMARYDSEKAEATFKDGILCVVIPAREGMKPKQITIKSK